MASCQGATQNEESSADWSSIRQHTQFWKQIRQPLDFIENDNKVGGGTGWKPIVYLRKSAQSAVLFLSADFTD